MNIKQIQVKHLIKTITKKDTLFHGTYTLDAYQNCSFGCIYCDSTLDDTIYVKINAASKAKEELQQLNPGRIIIGSVHDPYQPVEQQYHLTHDLLSYLSQTNNAIHILTKSTTILNDLSLLKKVTHPMVTFTVLGLNHKLWKTIEPNTPSPQKRLKAMQTLAQHNITTGIAIIPTLPHLTDHYVEELIKKAKNHDASYILHKPLFLQGRQKQLFLQKLKRSYPEVYTKYQTLYNETPTPSDTYVNQIKQTINKICNEHRIPTSIPIQKKE